MKPILKRNPNTELDFQLQGSLYESLYARIGEILPEADRSVFCSIERRRSECIWHGQENTQYHSLPTLSEEDKFELSDLLASAKNRILPILMADRILGPHAETFFRVATEEDIYLSVKPDGNKSVALSRWAIKLALRSDDADPIVKLINIPKPDHFPVIASIRYSDGLPYAEAPFYFSYLDNTKKKFKTNEEGLFPLGKLKKGRTFGISQFEEDGDFSFKVDPDTSIYEATFPRYLDFEVIAVNQDEEPLPSQMLLLRHGASERLYITDEAGLFYVESHWLNNEPIEIATEDGQLSASYDLSPQTDRLVFRIHETVYGEVAIIVKDQDAAPYPTYPICIEQGGQENSYETDSTGTLYLGEIVVNQMLQVIDGRQSSNKLIHTVTEGHQEIILQVVRPVIPPTPPVRVQLLNHKGKPIPAIPLDFSIGGTSYEEITNEEGSVFLDKNLFPEEEKIKVNIHLKNKKGKDKLVKKSFKYEEETDEYTIRLKKRNWWWLLLLLLPLLLIRCEKDLHVHVRSIDTNVPVENAVVHFKYHKSFLYDFDSGGFFANHADLRLDSTGANGLVTFSSLKYSVYSFIFKFMAPAITFSNSDCFTTDTLSPRFHALWHNDTLKLKAAPALIPLDFIVVDADDGEPLPDAKVVIEAAYLGKVFRDSSTTDAAGRVIFTGIPKCGELQIAHGSLEGYLPDEIKDKIIPEIAGDPKTDRTLKLEPIKEKLIFFVEDCKTGRRIPGAEVTIEFDYNGKKSTKKKKTNVNGVGKGEYDEAHVIADVTLIGEAPPYYKPGKLPTYRVDEFIKLPDSLRTICLEPIPNAVSFKNVDSLTNKPLAGVTNEIVIENGGTRTENTVLSDKDGNFVVVINPGDVVSIISEYPPDYEDNTSKINKADGIKLKDGPQFGRTIPLKPRMAELLFRTVDFDNPSQIVPNAQVDVQLAIDGTPINIPTPSSSDANGEFIVEAPLVASISIVASKTGYGSNNTKIYNESVKSLELRPQADRDIPLKKESPPPCNEQMRSGGNGTTVNEFNMMDANMKFRIEYSMKSMPDQIIVYCGRANRGGKELFRTPSKVSGNGSVSVDLSVCGGSTWITVVIIGGGSGTSWDYRIICPNLLR